MPAFKNCLFRPVQEWPVVGEYDVVVAGGGAGGFGAAIAAARLGARTILLEQAATPGGVATNAMVPNIMGVASEGRQICGGILEELLLRLGEMGYGYEKTAARVLSAEPLKNAPILNTVVTSVHGLQLAMLRMLAETGVVTSFYTRLVGAHVEDGRVVAVAVDAPEGLGLLRARTFVDATGDANLVWRAGGETSLGAADEVMTKTLLMDVGGVRDFNPEAIAVAFAGQVQDGTVPVAIQDRFMGYRTFEPGVVQLNFSAIIGDALQAGELSRMDRELREQVEAGVAWFRRYIPGFADCYLLRTPGIVGVRAGRCGVGRETITLGDIDGNTAVNEPVAVGIRRYGDHGTQHFSAKWAKPVSGWRSIPRGALLQKDLFNVALAGRAISCQTKVITCIRYIAQCVCTGQAAGVNAALALGCGGNLAAVGYDRLRDTLLAQGAILELPAASL